MKNRSIAWKMIVMLILLILPFNVVSIITTTYLVRNVRQQTVSSLKSIAELSMQQMDNRLSAMNDFFYNLPDNRQDFLVYQKQGERTTELAIAETALARYFSMIAENSAFADALFWQSSEYERFCISVGSLQSMGYNSSYQYKMLLRPFLESEEKLQYMSWRLARIGETKWALKVYEQNGLYYGSLISLDEIAANLKKGSGYHGMEVRFEEKGTDSAADGSMLETFVESTDSDIRMCVSVPKSESMARLTALQLLCIGFAFFYLLLIPVLIWQIHRMVIRPLRNVEGAMVHLRSGEQDYRITAQTDTAEFREINETFNSMADHISELKIENYEKELERQRMELRNLQLQIRPHFLMNLFNLLYSFAQIENYQSIQTLALYLSEYFRYFFQSGKELQPFSAELDLIQKYMEVAAMRYPDCCEAVYEIDPEVLEVEVPPLLFHNFVENIFKHLVNYEKKIHLRIEAFADEKEATFMIVDDGPGMAPEMVEDINRGVFHDRRDDRVHVGIENSYRRMKYFYGEQGSITVESGLGQGTCFTVVIPVGRKA